MTTKSGIIEKSAVLALGMHRSGTSALARSLAYFGFALPEDLMAPQADNPKGFWEPRAVVQLNDEILAALGGSWEKPGPFLLPGQNLSASRERLSRAIAGHWLNNAVAALRASFRDASAIILKDPRLGLFLPLWRAALAEAGFASYCMLMFRNPLEVAGSLRARNGMAVRQSLLLWQTYNLCALEFVGGANVAMVSYERLLNSPADTVGRAFDKLELPVDPLKPDAADALRAFISAEDRHHVLGADDLSRAPLCAAQIREMWELLTRWDTFTPRNRKKALAGLSKAFDEAVIFAGTPKRAGPKQLTKLGLDREPAPAQRSGRPADRARAYDAKICPLVLHYHLFKNAGTSVDEILSRNFGSGWATAEFPPSGAGSNVAAVEAYLRGKLDILALSSHTALLPKPDLDGRAVIPVIFIRHPIDRLNSAYEFERRQAADTLGSRLAKAYDFTGYLRALLASPGNRQARNFQSNRLAFNEPQEAGSEEERAVRTLEALDFVGLVEAFDASMERLATLLGPMFAGFESATVRKNASRGSDALGERLARIRSEIGGGLYDELIVENGSDLRIFDLVRNRYGVPSP